MLMTRWWRTWWLGVVLLGGGAAWGQVAGRTGANFHHGSSYMAEAQLRNAAGLVRDGQWAEAVEIYIRVIGQYGDTVALVPKDDPSADPSGESQLYVDAGRHCQRRLAALPAEARTIYCRRVDAQAERL